MPYFCVNNTVLYQTDLEIIAKHAHEKEDENYCFRSWLKMKEDKPLDRLVHEINDKVSAAIDCTKCGNCCKTLVINVVRQEMTSCSKHLNISKSEFKEKYIEESQEGELFINTIPCHFFADKKCTIYDHRFKECRDFPHLHKPGFKARLAGTLNYYGSCPIIYNVIEEMKVKTGFLKE